MKYSATLTHFWTFLKLSEDEDWLLLRMFMRLWYRFLFSKQLSQRSRPCQPAWHRTTALQNDGEKTIFAFEIRPPFCRRSYLTSSNKGEAQNPSCSEKYPPYLSFSSLCPHHFSITICQGLSRLVPHVPYSRLIIHPPKPQLFLILRTLILNDFSDSLLNPPHFLSLSASQSSPHAPWTSTLILSKSLNSTSL